MPNGFRGFFCELAIVVLCKLQLELPWKSNWLEAKAFTNIEIRIA